MNTPTGERVAVVVVNGAVGLALALIALVGLVLADEGVEPTPTPPAVTQGVQP